MARRAAGKETKRPAQAWVPITVVGTALTAALMVLLLLSQSRLSQMGFAISALEQELEALETQKEKLLISHAETYSVERVERYAMEELGMVHPNPDQYRFTDIETAEHRPGEPSETTVP